MNAEEKLRQFLELLSTLRTEAAKTPIIVEGKKDVAALRALGFESEIVQLNRGLPLLTFCERLARDHDRVIILCDWDRTGGKITRHLINYFDSLDVDYDIAIRRELIFVGRRHVKDVEGIHSYITELLIQLKLPCELRDLVTLYENRKILF